MIELVATYGRDALVASTLVLAAGSIAVLLIRRWDGRQLAAEFTVGVALLAGLQAFAPLSVPRSVSSIPLSAAEGTEAAEFAKAAPLPLHWETMPAAAPPQEPALVPPSSAQRPTRSHAQSRVQSRAQSSADRRGRKSWRLSSLLPWLMLCGSLVVAAYCALGYALVWRIHFSSLAAPAAIAQAVDRLAGCRVDSRVVASLRTAFCYGLFRPRLAIPQSLVSSGTGEPLGSVLQHEASHLRRRDSLRRSLVSAAGPLLFWNPLYWWLAREAALCAEFIADGSATRTFGKNSYAKELILLATSSAEHHAAPLLHGSHFLRRHGELRKRILMIKNAPTEYASRTSRAWRFGLTSIGTVSLAALTLSLGRAPEQELGTPDPPQHQKGALSPETYDLSLEAPTPASLGLMVSRLSLSVSDGGGWFSVKVLPNGSTPDGPQSVQIRGVSLGSLQELETIAEEAGVLLVSLKPRPVGPALKASRRASEIAGFKGALKGVSKDGSTFTFEGEDVPIADLISSIASASNVNFVLSPEVQGHVTVRFHGVPWREALDASVHALGYRVIDENRSVLRIVPEFRVTVAAPKPAPPTIEAPMINAPVIDPLRRSYTVCVGDTLAAIAKRQYGRVSLARAIALANGLDSKKNLRVGQVLFLPTINRSTGMAQGKSEAAPIATFLSTVLLGF